MNKEKLEVSFSHARTTRKKQKQRAPSSLPTRFTRIRPDVASVGTPICNLSTLEVTLWLDSECGTCVITFLIFLKK